MIRRTTWILLGILIVGLAAVFYLEKNPVQPANTTPTPTAEPDLLSGWSSDAINRVEFKENGSLTLTVELDAGGSWQFVGGKQSVVDQGKVAQLLSSITSQRVTTTLAPDTDLKAVGLAENLKELTLQQNTGEIVTIQIGSVTLTSGGYYVRVNDGTPVVISKNAVDDALSMLSPEGLAAATPTPAEPTLTKTP